jgi:serine/threonine protein kinase/tetratricopeptide (TPR) repeat protein
MSERTPARPAAGNLLFGTLALQLDLVSRDQLLTAMSVWDLERHRPLGEILQSQGALAEDERAVLDALVDIHLRRHGGNPERSLASAGAARAAHDDLRWLADSGTDPGRTQVGTLPESAAPAGSAAGPVSDDTPLCCAVRYRVLRPHARGGLGEVFVAEDIELHREVAFKEIQRPYAHDPRSRSRFLLEAEVNGKLEHPGVVPVYGLGSYRDGRPFYAMRFIHGESLQDTIRRFHKADVPGRDVGERGLALRQLLGQFVAVCNAVAYAHSRGVLHRDLKPANVMLGKFGETLLVDWGLAKVLGRPEGAAGEEAALYSSSGDGSATAAGTAMGTPAYMSPEQAAGRLDLLSPASDIYSLGATLYTLLTGQAPIRGDDTDELLRRASRGEWVPPRQVKKGVPAALDGICRKAMALRPEDRYATAQALAADVEHWLADEPVTAYREPLHRRLGRWRRRHPALAAGLAVLLLAVAAVGVWLKLERDAVERDVRAALQEVAQLHGQGRWADARVALERARGRLAGGGPGALRDRVRQAETDLEMVAELEEIRLRQTEVKDGEFDMKGADPAYAAAFRRYGLEPLAADPEQTARRIEASAIREQLIVALDHWAGTRPAQDARGRQRLLSLARRADRDEWRRGLRDPAVRDDPEALRRLAQGPGALEQPPVTALTLAHSLWRVGERAETVALLRRAQRRHPGDFWLNQALAAYLRVSEPSRTEEALGFHRAALAVRPRSAGAHVNVGNALHDQVRYKEAEAAFRRALEFKEDFPLAHANLAASLSAQGRPREAEAACRRALQLKKNYPMAHANLGAALGRQERYKEAEAACRRALELDKDYPLAHINLGAALNGQGRHKEAETACRRAIELRGDLALAYANLGNALHGQRRYKEAEAACRRALKLKEDLSLAHANLGVILNGQGRHKEAEAACRRALELEGNDPQTHYSLGNALYWQGRYREAEDAYHKAVQFKDDFPRAHCLRGLALQRLGRFAEAVASIQRGHDLWLKNPPWPNPSIAMLREARRLLELDRQLTAVLKGQAEPADARERLDLARLCRQYKGLYAAAARFYAEAFADPNLTDGLRSSERHHAARAAALAASGKGEDAASLDAAERGRLRGQALAWLRADLGTWAGRVEKGAPPERAAASKTLRQWQSDPDLTAVRDASALAGLTETERAEWQRFWADVQALLERADGKGTSAK